MTAFEFIHTEFANHILRTDFDDDNSIHVFPYEFGYLSRAADETDVALDWVIISSLIAMDHEAGTARQYTRDEYMENAPATMHPRTYRDRIEVLARGGFITSLGKRVKLNYEFLADGMRAVRDAGVDLD